MKNMLWVSIALLGLMLFSIGCSNGWKQPSLEAKPQEAKPGGYQVFVPMVKTGNEGQASPTPEGAAPHIEIQATKTDLSVGEVFTVTGNVVDIGLPYYYLYAQDEGATEPVNLAQLTYDNQLRIYEAASNILEVVSAQGEMRQAVYVLKAKAPGTTHLWINATGEVQYTYPQPYFAQGGGGSDELVITVK